MSVNRYQHHVIIIPEDDADKDIVNGFCNSHHLASTNRLLKVVDEAGGWMNAKDTLEKLYVPYLQNYPKSRVVLVIDFDSDHERRQRILENVPEEIKDRVFVIGSLTNPEALRRDLQKSFEHIGSAIADECAEETSSSLWNADLLRHNLDEVRRLSKEIRNMLFHA